jgi:hypothetical protein
MRDLPAAIFFSTDKFRKSQVTSRLRIATENATVNTFRPVERTYSTKITRFRRPQTATFRFIAHQACILYHKSPQIARVIYRLFRRNLYFLKPPKYTNCTKPSKTRGQKGGRAAFSLFFSFSLPFFYKKMIIIFEKCAIGHILFKFVLYNRMEYARI